MYRLSTDVGGTFTDGILLDEATGVMILALINNGFNILNVNPFYKDLTTGLIIVLAVALSTMGSSRK